MELPPRIATEQDITPFIDGLEDIVSEKIAELFSFQDKLLQEKKDWHTVISHLQRVGVLGSLGVYFWTLWTEISFTDYYVSQKWVQYWLLILRKIPHTKIAVPKEYHSRLEREMRVEQAKTVPIENFYQGQLRGSGTRFAGKCPFHEEKTPSFFIYSNTNTFNCFGCGKNGDVIDFLMLTREISFNEVLELLR